MKAGVLPSNKVVLTDSNIQKIYDLFCEIKEIQ